MLYTLGSYPSNSGELVRLAANTFGSRDERPTSSVAVAWICPFGHWQIQASVHARGTASLLILASTSGSVTLSPFVQWYEKPRPRRERTITGRRQSARSRKLNAVVGPKASHWQPPTWRSNKPSRVARAALSANRSGADTTSCGTAPIQQQQRGVVTELPGVVIDHSFAERPQRFFRRQR
jgi:hypothetical protein